MIASKTTMSRPFQPLAPVLLTLAAAGLTGCADEFRGGGGGGPDDPTPCVVFCGPTAPPPPAGLADCDPNNPNAPFRPIRANVDTVETAIEGPCISCRIASPASTFDGNLNTFSVNTAGVGLGTTLSQIGFGPLPYQTSPTVRRRIGFFVSYPTDVTADVALQASTSAYTVDMMGNDVEGPGVSTDTALSLQLVGFPLLAGQSLAFVSVVTTQPFNGARLAFSPTVGVLSGLDVIEACISK